ncbi:hypothetical protein ZWY2020_043119 [Hordeum vulgare]|nr:hypothetical protein ZWY2020_043119 [Hordeum vulgare]
MRRVLLPPSDFHTAASRVPGGTGLGGAMEEKRGREGRGGKKEAEKGERAAAYQRRHRLPPRRGSRLERNRAKMNGAERSGLDLLLDLLHLLKQDLDHATVWGLHCGVQPAIGRLALSIYGIDSVVIIKILSPAAPAHDKSASRSPIKTRSLSRSRSPVKPE